MLELLLDEIQLDRLQFQ